MAILENIRKRTTILILIIGLALFAFVISGIFTNSNTGGVKVGSSVAEINGEEVSIDEFRNKVDLTASRYGGGASSMQMVNLVYNQEVRNAILEQQFDDLGIEIEQDQIINYIKSNPAYSQSPQFVNESGIFDENKFKSFVADLKANAPVQYQLWLQEEKAIIQQAKEQIYFNLIKAGVGATLKEGEYEYKLANDKVDIQYVRVPYTSISDSSITVSKKEIESYINKHEKDYQQEDARDIQYVYFEEKPSLADETAVKDEITALLKDSQEYQEATDTTITVKSFKTTDDVAAYLDVHSDTKFDTIYKAKKDLPSQFADTLLALNIGDVYGPYKDGETYKLARMMNKKANGSVKASHILISYTGAERANPNVTRTKEEAEKKANEVLKEALKADAVFTTLARENSDGPSAPNGGDLGYFQEGVMTPKFNDFAFNNKVGHVGLVETEFGYHIVKVDDKQDIVQLAILTREIETSEATSNTLFTDATTFESTLKNSDKDFAAVAKESEYAVKPVNKIKAMDENLPGLTAQRAIVKWAFNEDTKLGDVKRFNLSSGYAVVQLTGTYRKGLMSVEDASATVLPILRKEKKAAQIISANKGKSLDDFASSNSVVKSTASALTVKSPTIPGAGREPLVVGTAFAMDKDATSGLIEGNSGVFMVKVTNKTAAKELDNYSVYATQLQTAAAGRVNTAVYNALKEDAEIEDKRPDFY